MRIRSLPSHQGNVHGIEKRKKEPLAIFPPWALREEEELNKIHSIKLMKRLNKKIMSWTFT